MGASEVTEALMKEMQKSIVTLMIVSGVMLASPPVPAQEGAAKDRRPTIQATGEATLTVRPDQALINIGVVTQAQTAQAAATQNAQRLDAVLAELHKAVGTAGEVKTLSYALSPIYRYPKDGGQPEITGYTASNILQVKVNDLSQVGKIIDTSTQSGANTIQSLQFGLKDEQAARARALQEAAIQGKIKAEAIASALGVRIVRLLSAQEGGPVVVPRVYATMAGAAGRAQAPTSVEPGNIEVRASVVVTYEIGG
jgi:uncharacterized protein YggE